MALFVDLVALSNGLHGSVQMDSVALFSWIGWLRHHGILTQESKRLGLCQKSMFVVPNHLVGQWASEYLRLYPSANILVTSKRDFETGNRKKFCGRIATGDYDAVIIGHSQFETIPMSIERQREQLEK